MAPRASTNDRLPTPSCSYTRRADGSSAGVLGASLFAGLIGLLLGRAQDYEVICILHQHPQPSPVGHPHLVQDVQSDVSEQR